MDKLTPAQQAEVTTLRAKLGKLKKEINCILKQGRLIATEPNQLFLFKGMHQELKPSYDAYNDTWDKLSNLVTKWGSPSIFPTEEDQGSSDTIRRHYYECCAIYEHHMHPTPQAGAAAISTQGHASGLSDSRVIRAKLPQINLPKFDGTQADWPLFRDTYRSLIHDEATLSDIEKFLFLVSCLEGSALTLIKGVELQEANYQQAWKILNERYNDKRRLANSYLKVLLEFEPLKGRPSGDGFKRLLTTVGEAVESFKQLNIPHADDFLLFSLTLRCLDQETRRNFEKKYSHKEFPLYNDLIEFLKIEWRSLELTCEDSYRQDSKPAPQHLIKQQATARVIRPSTSLLSEGSQNNSSNRQRQPPCPVCNYRHALHVCRRFQKLLPSEKRNALNLWKGCLNCLSSFHTIDECPSQRSCSICAQRHHSWLHIQQSAKNTITSTSESAPSASEVTLGARGTGQILLGTTLLEIKDRSGTFHTMRAVIDSGSQHSFITKERALQLGLVIQSWEQNITGIGDTSLADVLGQTTCTVRSLLPAQRHDALHAQPIVVSRITRNLPQTPVSVQTRALYDDYVLADEEFWKPGPIDFLLGADLYFDIITAKPIKIAPEAPRLLPTIFGHIIGGPSSDKVPADTVNLLVQSDDDIKPNMAKFWEIEEVSKRPISSQEEIQSEKHFQSTHRRLPSGRYIVSLPLKQSISTLFNPRQQALSRLLNLEVKLNKNPSLRSEYHKFMEEYLALGHMRPVPSNTSAYTIPHHAVLKFQNGKYKLRVVFDASCQTRSGSLNDHMLSGPKLQLDISDIISNLRIYQFVFAADIVKMYRQVLVEPSDRKYQHILWRFNPKDEVREYELCTVTYGEKASAFLAQRTIHQLVADEGKSYPAASRALLEDIYVDDIATGADTVNEVLALKEQLMALLARGEFQLSKWTSNCPELLATINKSELGDSNIGLSDDAEDARIKLLGIQWSTKEDAFSYEIHTPAFNPTKRAVLSAIARIYDPLGYLSPVIFHAKVIMQEMWIAKIGWDENGPPHVCSKWFHFIHQLKLLDAVRIPRRLTTTPAYRYTLVGFSDASLRGYAAVIYLHAVTTAGCQVSLLKAKTKLAPIKPMTVPRLELAGALLLCRLYQSISHIIQKLTISKARFYTDSQIVLAWLSTPAERLNAFVAHRVIEILEHTSRNQWEFVLSEDNPADVASRGISPADLPQHPLWWAGPLWLSTTEDNWPTSTLDPLQNVPEVKLASTVALASTDYSSLTNWMERFSSYPKVVRSIAYVLRFINKARHRTTYSGPITVSEYRTATKKLIKVAQHPFSNGQGQLVDDSHLRTLHPFFDAEGLIRVGGRLHHSNLHFDAKHPYLIPAKCHLAKILVDHLHKTYLHLGPAALHATLQLRYWIPGARGLIRRRIFNCVTCYKASRRPQAPLMGNLPLSRLEEGHVFQQVGVDFAGPFLIRFSLRRKAAVSKAYLCLFVCMTTKAVHLELVSSCSTDAFLASFSRFIARRGKPSHVFSDCGTNFIGAANRMRDFILMLRSPETQEKVLQKTVPQEINWSFNPPSTPHFGGLWEAAIKSCKNILHKIIGDTPLTFEELSTIFCNIEGILNSRPLASHGSDPNNADCLTPGHFLIGRPLTASPHEGAPQNVNTLQRWGLLQQKTQLFWNRWRLEYLNQLQQRRKWTKETPSIRIGDVVIIKEPDSILKSWPLGRVVETHPGDDGIVRVVTIRTATGTYKRPVTKLVPLTPLNT